MSNHIQKQGSWGKAATQCCISTPFYDANQGMPPQMAQQVYEIDVWTRKYGDKLRS